MTSTERTAIENLRTEVHNYHVEVKEFVARSESMRNDVDSLLLDVRGIPGKLEECPGLNGIVADLSRSRKMTRYALRGAWALLTVLFGAVIAKLWPA